MAAPPRESSFMPSVKCSLCAEDIPIADMGSHICATSGPSTTATEAAPPPASAGGGLFGNAFASLKSTAFGFGGGRQAVPAQPVDTSAANQAFQDQLTPNSSRGSKTSPKTPTNRGNDYFSPEIAEASPPQRVGGYGGFGEQTYDEPMYGGQYSSSPKQAFNQKLDTLAPGPFKARAKNAFAPKSENSFDDNPRDGYRMERSDTANSYSSNENGVVPPSVPRKNGYGGFGPPPGNQEDDFEPRFAAERSATVPEESGTRPVRPRRPTNENVERPVTRDRQQRPLRDTSRAPPPRQKSLVPPPRDGSISIDLANEFGASNPYAVHTPSVSSDSGYSKLSQPSLASTNNTSPARSMESSKKAPSDTKFDDLMDDLQSSMNNLNSRERPPAPPQPPPVDKNPTFGSGNRRPPPESLRSDPAIQGRERVPRTEYPLASPDDGSFMGRRDPAVQGGDPAVQGAFDDGRSRSPARRPHNRKPSMSRSRGSCKACGLPITGKSISSADGRLSGRYHKACFVCTTCQEPFSSSTFYVLDDKPYCEQHYHKLNGSLCGTCGIGIEGQYLEDEQSTKYHVGCFTCADCGRPLRDGYFEVSGVIGKSFCERDAWKHMNMMPPPGRGPRPSPGGRPPYGLPSGRRLAPPGSRPRMAKRMTRLGMM